MDNDDDNTGTKFCKGMYMTMFMDGFNFSLGREKGNPASCLNYFVRSWKLEDPGKFKGAMFFTFLLAVLVEALSAVRGKIIQHTKRRTRHALLTLCYTTQGLLGYILMLITMSFSVELVSSVIFGLMSGNMIFMRYDEVKPPPRTPLTMHQTNQSVQSQNDNDNNEFEPLLLNVTSQSLKGGSSHSLRKRT